MQQGAVQLGKVRGIAVGIHPSWLLAAILITWSLGQGWYPASYPGWSTPAYYLAGAISAALLFLSVILHEFGHALTAQRFGIPVRSIVVFLFGGIATLDRDSDSPKAEFWIAVMGPVVSALLALLFWLLRPIAALVGTPAEAIISYLAIVNGLLLLFNLIPGFPLDGGRILRAILWAVTDNQRLATTIASVVGQIVAFGLIIWGVARIISGDLFGGIWTAFIGWFLNSAAAETRRAAPKQDALRGITVAQLTRPDPPTVQATTTLAALVREQMLPTGERTHLVYDQQQFVGLITQTDILRYPENEWPQHTVGQAMTPAAQLKTVTPTTSLTDALHLLAADNFDQLPVLAQGQPVGLLSRATIVRFLQMQAQFGARRSLQRPEQAPLDQRI